MRDDHYCRECMGRCELVSAAYEQGRREAQAQFVNNIAAVLDADDVEMFTALVMKAKQSPVLNSKTRSALKAEAEIRREAREEAFRDVGHIINNAGEEWGKQARDRRSKTYSAYAIAALELKGRIFEAAKKGDTDG